MRAMVAPRVIPRAEHTLSRRAVDPDALKVLYRLRQFNHIAYLVGGSVRDLLLERRPKDFDIGTSAHPYQIKKLFRNCWIIGRRFRLAHVKFGPKVIEVATFRRQVQPGEEVVQDGVPAPDPATPEGQQLIHHDNTFGTPEEDAFRRDFTINALFYDIETFAVIDYVDGLEDLRAGVVRSIGDPEVRFREDPVRMLRAIALASRLSFTIDPPVLDAIRLLRHEIAHASAARLLEEYYKILRSGHAEQTFRGLASAGLLEPVAEELHKGAGDALWQSLAALDAYRRQFEEVPESFTNPVLLGTLLVALGFSGSVQRSADGLRAPGPRLGNLPLARRDVERLRQMLGLQRRLGDLGANPRAQRAVVHRTIFRDALNWLEVHGGSPELVAHWKALAASGPAGEGGAQDEPPPFKRRRRRRRRRYRPAPQ
jgi:poly(A) polymerase